MRVGTCLDCGTTFTYSHPGPATRRCPEHQAEWRRAENLRCAHLRSEKGPRPCLHCGRLFEGKRARKYCPEHRRPADRGPGRRMPAEHVCAWCHRVFTNPSNKGQVCCSRACRGAKQQAETAQRRASVQPASPEVGAACDLNWSTCGDCGVDWLNKGRRRRNSVTRCLDCRRGKDRLASQDYYHTVGKARRGHLRHQLVCVICGQPFIGHGARLVCDSPVCKKAQMRAARKRAKVRRRFEVVEMFDASEIFERDGFRCQICNRALKVGAVVPDPMAPTIDHILPVSKGGQHTRANVRAAHFICNSLRSNVGTAQLRLA